MRLFSGRLAPRDALEFKGNAAKITAIRTLQPAGRRDLPAMEAGDVAVVYGLPDCRAGDILGDASQLPRDLTPGKLMEPLLMSQVIPAGEQDMPALRRAMLLALSNYLRDTPEAPFACMAQINAIFAILLGGTPYRVLSDTENMTQTRNAERMHRILHYLETHYSEPVRLSEIAEREGLTQTYLSHLFREQLHIPFQDYLGRLRLEAAMLLLRQSDTTLTDAAYACGFSDPKYLNRSFQKNLGMSPRQWLLENRPDPSRAPSAEDPRTAQRILTPGECRALLDVLGVA